jgi:hypothetical protein
MILLPIPAAALFVLLARVHPLPAEVASATLRTLEFVSGHKVIRQNMTDVTTGGERYPDVEWDPETGTNAPVTHTVGERVRVRLGLRLHLPDPALSFTLTGTSQEPGLCFKKMGTISPGEIGVEVEAACALGGEVRKIREPIHWTLSLRWDHSTVLLDLGSTGPHILYTTFGRPRDSEAPLTQVTDVRMDLAVRVVTAALSKAERPFSAARIVHAIVKWSGRYYCPTRHYGGPLAWRVPETWDMSPEGASCISIVEFSCCLCKVVGIDSEVAVTAFYALPINPRKAVPGGLGDRPVLRTGAGRTWQLFLVDDTNTAKGQVGGVGGMNYYEAALALRSGGATYYFPGGTLRAFRSPADVIRIFRTLAWAEWEPSVQDWVVREVVYTYSRSEEDYPLGVPVP